MIWIWPSIQDSEDAQKAINMSSSVTFLAVLVTGAAAVASIMGHPVVPGLAADSLIDAAILWLLTIGVGGKSRIAALGGFFYYFGSAAYLYWTEGYFHIPYLIYGLIFFPCVRAVYAWHGEKRDEEENRQASAAAVPSWHGERSFDISSAKPPQPSRVRERYKGPGMSAGAVLFFLVAFGAIGAWAAGVRIHPEKFSALREAEISRIEFVSGAVEEGEITQRDDSKVTIHLAGGATEFQMSEIKSITKKEAKPFNIFGDSESLLTLREEDRIAPQIRKYKEKISAAKSRPRASLIPSLPKSSSSGGENKSVKDIFAMAEKAKALIEERGKQAEDQMKQMEDQTK